MESSKSEQIRELYLRTNLTVREIAEVMGVRYQFAYNVIKQLAESRGEEVRKSYRRRGRFSRYSHVDNVAEEPEIAHDVDSSDGTEPASVDIATSDDDDNDDNGNNEGDNNGNGFSGDGGTVEEGASSEAKSQDTEALKPRGAWSLPTVGSSKIVREKLKQGQSPEEIAEELHVNPVFVRNVAKLFAWRRSST